MCLIWYHDSALDNLYVATCMYYVYLYLVLKRTYYTTRLSGLLLVGFYYASLRDRDVSALFPILTSLPVIAELKSTNITQCTRNRSM